eukprot:1601670-Rhodomonas_salina.1
MQGQDWTHERSAPDRCQVRMREARTGNRLRQNQTHARSGPDARKVGIGLGVAHGFAMSEVAISQRARELSQKRTCLPEHMRA